MPRSFTAQDLIVLPRLDAAEAIVLSTELRTVADTRAKKLEGKKLPAAIERSRKRLDAASAALDAATRPQRSALDPQIKRKTDRAIDNAWSATFDWLGGWCKLPSGRNPCLADSLALFDLVFPDALSFTKLPYKIEWKESEARLGAIADGRHDKTFKRLGGEAFLEHIKETHKAYGEALHITAPKPAEAAASDVRTLYLAVLAALRDYATRVAAHADPDVAGSEALSEALLRPLAEWQSRPAAVAATDGEESPDSPDSEAEEDLGSALPGEDPAED